MCSTSKRTVERVTKELEAVGLLDVSRRANCPNRYEMRGGTDTDDGTDSRDGRVPTAVTGGTVRDDGGVPTRMSPKPLSEPLTQPIIEPLRSELGFAVPAGARSATQKEEKINGSTEVVRGREKKFDMEAFRAERLAAGMDMSLSRWRR